MQPKSKVRGFDYVKDYGSADAHHAQEDKEQTQIELHDKQNEPSQHLQSEYINNLQQQVYFLKLELQIM
eukprot:UN14233